MRWSLAAAGRGSVHLVKDPDQPIVPNGVRIEPLWCGICGTDLDIIRRERSDRPSVLGHEASASIVERGPLVENEFFEWKSVAVNPTSSRDQSRNFGHSLPGIWSTSRVITAEELADGHLLGWKRCSGAPETTLVEPLASVVYAHELLQVQPSRSTSMLLIGSGAFACLAALYFSYVVGCDVSMVGAGRSRMAEIAGLLGIAQGGTTTRASIEAQCSRQFDVVVVAVQRTAATDAVQLAFRCVRKGGLIDLVCAVGASFEQMDEPWRTLEAVRRANFRGNSADGVYHEFHGPNGPARVTGHRGSGIRHLMRAMALIEEAPEVWRRIITHVIPFRDAPFVLEALCRDRGTYIDGRRVIKAVLDCKINGS